MCPVSCTNTHHDITYLINQWTVKNLNILRMEHNFYETKKSEPVPQTTHFEKLSVNIGNEVIKKSNNKNCQELI